MENQVLNQRIKARGKEFFLDPLLARPHQCLIRAGGLVRSWTGQ